MKSLNVIAASLLVAALAFLGSIPAPAQPAAPAPQTETKPAPGAKPAPAKPDRLGEIQGWTAFAETLKNGKTCYLVGTPAKSEPGNLKRGDVYVYITHRPAEKSFNVINFVAGYAYKNASEVELAIDGKKFTLYTSLESAWARDAATEKAIVDAMAKGKQAIVKGTSMRGTATTDTYALTGFLQALALIDKACGTKR